MFRLRKGDKYSFNGDGNLDCEFLASTSEDGYPYNVGLVNHFKKEVSPCHGYHYPNRCAKSLMNYAVKLGYTYVDSEMPSRKNKTLLKKYYTHGRKDEIFIGQLKEFRPKQGVLIKYEIVDILGQWFDRDRDPNECGCWYTTHVAMRKFSETYE